MSPETTMEDVKKMIGRVRDLAAQGSGRSARTSGPARRAAAGAAGA
jgi:hypothetical protein